MDNPKDLVAFEAGRRPGLASGFGEPPGILALVLAILVTASAVYYAMLVYAPRQLVEREGTPRVWIGRFALFVVSVAFGVRWLAAIGT
jgi:hypothetical protein